MKLPKETNRYCAHCKAYTKHKLSTAKQKGRSTAHPLSRGSTMRLEKRGLRTGFGNHGKYSKPPVKNWKRKTKVTKRITLLYTCTKCGKAKGIRHAIRSGRIEVGEKVSK